MSNLVPNNIVLNTDSYKASHHRLLPKDARRVSSYIESRGGKFKETVFFGLQMFIKEYLLKRFTLEDIDEAEDILMPHMGVFNRDGWEKMYNLYGGRLPISISAAPEGTVIPTGNVMVQVENTDGMFPWLTSYVETPLIRGVWAPTTTATLSREIRKVIYKSLQRTSDDPDAEIDFKLHDFGARGVSSNETAGILGLSHLINFKGTDTLEGIRYGRAYYNEPMAGFSIPASEHSTITAWGGPEHEEEAFRNMLKEFGGEGKTFACVSDSYDIWNATDNIWGDNLKEEIINSGGTVVVRPDSGNPVDVPVEVIQRLMDKFGYTLNTKGFRVLPDYIRVIQGDGIDLQDIRSILYLMELKGLSASNIAFGMGGGLLQKTNRDTQKFAMKASSIYLGRDKLWHDVYKDPIGDKGKTSKKGRLKLTSELKTVRVEEEGDNIMREVFRNGVLLQEDSLARIRQRVG
jgi:nicotinamide phosphoribosyltransferase